MRKPLTVETADLEKVAAKATSGGNPSSGKLSKGGSSRLLSVGSTGEKWKVPTLERGFDLEAAKEKAFKTASAYMNKILNYDDLNVELEWQSESKAPVGHVKDSHTGKLVNSYGGQDMLKLYSQNQKERGIIVDGRV